jgi:hypothetical protein
VACGLLLYGTWEKGANEKGRYRFTRYLPVQLFQKGMKKTAPVSRGGFAVILFFALREVSPYE